MSEENNNDFNILISDDSDLFLRIAMTIIEDYLKHHDINFHFVTVQSSTDAKKVYDEYKGSLNLIITDLHCPEECSGINMIEHVRESDKELPILIITGEERIDVLEKAKKIMSSSIMRKQSNLYKGLTRYMEALFS